MSDNHRHIDKIFSEGLSDHRTTPPTGVWTGIKDNLDKKKRTGIIYRTAGIAAAILILLGLGGGILQMFRLDKEDNYLSTSSETLTKPGPEPEKMPAPRQPPSHYARTEIDALKDDREVFTTGEIKHPPPVIHTERKDYDQIILTPDHPELPRKKNNGLVSSSEPYSDPAILTGIKMSDSRHPSGRSGSQNRGWYASVSVAPNYSYRTLSGFSQGSPGKEHFNKKETGLTSLSFRFAAGYRVSERFTILTGFDMLGMGQSIRGLIIITDPDVIENLATSFPGSMRLKSHPVSNSLGEIGSEGPPLMIADDHLLLTGDLAGSVPLTMYGSSQDDPARITQGIYYLQVPVIARYYITNGATDLYVNGGIGASFLTGNRVTLRYRGENFSIGHTLNIRNFGITGILGFGMEKTLTGNLRLNLEPRITHFITPANTTPLYLSRPYSISLSGGISYDF
ncbi:MAG: hypothetical protein EA408_10875 [Marinilabiliales bacterium]|nr:MAG: hypothetical protein EA408_10875 [Marinilabiliales bacterium]